ncbi:MAG: TonB-dependent receptor [Sphingobium sp.]|nr:TonB-dependent receptor [Sphingobium sp.]
MRGKQSLCLACGLVLAAPAWSQDAPPSDIPILVTATGTRTESVDYTPTITAETYRYDPPTIREALDGVAGLRAVSTGGIGGGSYISIRGGEPNFTMILLDGVRLNDSMNSKGGAFDFGLIDPSLVERVEVDLGAVSAVHGSDALSGVINIRLREPTSGGTHIVARAEGGTQGDHGGGGSVTHGWSDGGLLVAGNAYDSGKLDEGSSLSREQALARFSQRIGGFDALAFGFYAHDRHSIFPEDSGGPQLAVLRDRDAGEGNLWTAALSLRRRGEVRVRPELSLSYAEQSSDTDTPAIAPGVLDGVPAMTAHNRLTRFEAIGNVVFKLPSVEATVGAAYLDERGRSTGTIDFGVLIPADFVLDRRTASGFAEATVTPVRDLDVNGAVRFDAVDGGPQQWTGKGGVSYSLGAGKPFLFARIGRAFKLPSMYALGHPLVGNPDLRPERSRNIEVGAQWLFRRGQRLRIAWFDNHFTDLIDFDPATFTNVNRARVDTRGLEAEGVWQPIEPVTLNGDLTYLEVDSATPLRNRPHWQGRAAIAWQATPKLELGGAVRFNSSFNDSSIPTGLIVTPGHAEVDARLRYSFSSAVRLDLAFRNIGDARTWQAVGYPVTARRLQLALSGTF